MPLVFAGRSAMRLRGLLCLLLCLPLFSPGKVLAGCQRLPSEAHPAGQPRAWIPHPEISSFTGVTKGKNREEVMPLPLYPRPDAISSASSLPGPWGALVKHDRGLADRQVLKDWVTVASTMVPIHQVRGQDGWNPTNRSQREEHVLGKLP